MEVDPELIVPDPTLPLLQGAIAPWTSVHLGEYFRRLLVALGEERGIRSR